ncbi:Stringent starvation protein B [Bosea sp. 62]|uniref:SspB family protein n=1 Tax=unclassified Bosea (in: a-proteobacteria) TaxID=2653178 RepID=UPI00125BE89E|nr:MULTISPECIES: ClpXP protease specificity-enhancing factor SspB [unclassified Bosea (in: a-proteobacteria)]CAD5246754.1 Stringent starvation protein B [Bosea sp. 21B]CAD5247104.1 Stringent starvation protein B [Bosea sp. 7B]CAD5269297.1 Stringent starvation protein B [Bosea sp. 46]VVT50686.1 Stringent starvation protein B [Bosea sp. EC-HK365B]VXA97872.1 Stringent starvation protein B [Bosea sp. 127]
MTKDILRYDLMVQDALKGVVRKILAEAGRDGLPGDHHFYITFRTTAPGVRLSQRLREKHPDEMTIVLQHQFWDLNVSDHAFEVGLSFSGVPERLLIPYDAITTFFDPSVQFGLKFETQDAAGEAQASEPAAPAKAPRGAASEPSVATPLALPAKAPVKSLPAAKLKAAETDEAGKPGAAVDQKAAEAEEDGGAQVVSLDAFRKKT